jgi:hypothetical protein
MSEENTESKENIDPKGKTYFWVFRASVEPDTYIGLVYNNHRSIAPFISPHTEFIFRFDSEVAAEQFRLANMPPESKNWTIVRIEEPGT